MAKPEVSIIIVTWNQPEYTVPCIKSVLKQPGNYEIIVVDNCSDDNSLSTYKKEFGKNGKVKIINAGRNRGYTGGNNLGVKRSKGKYIVILNNDTTVEKNWLRELLSAIKSSPDIGAVNSFEIREGKKVDINLRKEYQIRTNILQYGIKIKRKTPKKEAGLVDASSIRGACFIYRKDVIDPPFDEDYFIYAEETKMAWIMRCKGYKIKLSTKSIFNHHHNVTRKTNKRFARLAVYLGERNRIMNLFTFYQPITTLKMLPLLIAQVAVSNILQPIKIPMRLKAYFWLLSHIRTILKKRKDIQSLRKISDKELLKEMTWRLFPRTSSEYK